MENEVKKQRCEYELFVERYFDLPPDISEKEPITTDNGQLVNMLAMFDEERNDDFTVHNLALIQAMNIVGDHSIPGHSVVTPVLKSILDKLYLLKK